MMTLSEIKNLGRQLTLFLAMFADCFSSLAGRQLLRVYVKGPLSDIKRKNCEAIALKFGRFPRTLQRFLESIKWNEERVRDRCQQIIARDHAHDEAIGTVDESGTAKSGSYTAAVARQYNGNRGKVENCTVGVHLGYSIPGFQIIIDSQLYLPEDGANDPERRKKNYIPDEIEFQTKPQIALGLIDRALRNGIQVLAWTFDELYGLDAFNHIAQAESRHMEALGQALARYRLSDPVAGNMPGQFTDPKFANLYNELVRNGSVSAVDAVKVGLLIEEMDIADLREAIQTTTHDDLRFVYNNLMRGSSNHLRAFASLLHQARGSYEPQHLTQQEYDAILLSNTGTGNGRRSSGAASGQGTGRGGAGGGQSSGRGRGRQSRGGGRQ